MWPYPDILTVPVWADPFGRLPTFIGSEVAYGHVLR